MQGLFQHLTPPVGHLCCQAVAAKAHPTHAHSHAAVFHETGTNQAGSGLYEKLILDHGPSLPQITGKHADTVPAHLRFTAVRICLLYTSPSPRDGLLSRMPSSA